MKKIKVYACFALSASLLLCGCGTDKPAVTTTETAVTTTVATEAASEEATTTAVTSTTTAATTTTAVTTTAKKTTTSAKEEIPFEERYLIMPKKALSEQVDILEKYFYGRWCTDEEYHNGDPELVFSDRDDIFMHGIQGNIEVSEIETGYALYCLWGGVWACWYIDKSEPDKLYHRIDGVCFRAKVTIDDDGHIFGDFLADDADMYLDIYEMKNGSYTYSRGVLGTQSGNEMSVLGQIELNCIYGVYFDKMTDMLKPVTDESGKEWVYVSGGYGAPLETRYLLDRTDDSVTIAYAYYKNKEQLLLHWYELEGTERYYAFTFTRDSNGEWSVGEPKRYLPISCFGKYDTDDRIRKDTYTLYHIKTFDGRVYKDITYGASWDETEPLISYVTERYGKEAGEKLKISISDSGIKNGALEKVIKLTDVYDKEKYTVWEETDDNIYFLLTDDVVLQQWCDERGQYCYKLWELDGHQTKIREAVLLFREYPEMNAGYKYGIDAIEFMVGYATDGMLYPKEYYLNVVTDSQYQNDIRKFAEENGIDESCYRLTEKRSEVSEEIN